MTEQMRRAPVIGNAPSSIIRATGLGSPRNGLPDRKPYVYRGNQPDKPRDPAETARIEKLRATLARQRAERELAAEGTCPDCAYPLDSWGHSVACEDGS